jgi:ribosome-associated protein
MFVVPDDELEFRATRSGGPGGQHVNTSSTRVEVRWNVRESPSLSQDQRARLLRRLATRLDARGTLRVVVGARRSQKQNRETAVERLNALVREALKVRKPRKKTKPSRAAVERRLREKKERSERKAGRRRVDEE